MHEYRSPALKRLNCLLSEMDAAYHEAALRQGLNDSSSRILYALCELGSPASLRAVCESTGLSKQTVNSALRKLEAEWPAEDVQQYLGLMERYLQAFRCKLPELGGQE